MRGHPAAVFTAAVLTAAVVLAGCGATDNGGAVGGANGGKSATTLPAGTLRADLPAAVASAGALRVGIESGSAPLSSTGSGGTPTGLDVELLQAAARLLGTSITFVGESQAAIGAGLRSGKLDLGVGALADSASSRAGGLHFMDYLRGQLAVLVRAGNPLHVAGLTDLCGRHVGVVDAAAAGPSRAASTCSAAGRLVDFSGPAEPAVLADQLGSGQLDAVLEDSLVANYAAQASAAPNELQAVGSPGDPVVYGVAVTNAGVQRALTAALAAVFSDGTYARVLERWGAQGAAVAAVTTDGGT